MAFDFTLNGEPVSLDVEAQMPLLWAIRDIAGLTGTKYGCGIGQCGACTIHLNGTPMKACTLPVDGVSDGQKIITIEGLSPSGDHPLQKSWVEAQVPQCGYCQTGQIMQAAALLRDNPQPTRAEILLHMNGNLCRCGTYMRIVKAIQMASGTLLSMKEDS